jgi:hypothetical protein
MPIEILGGELVDPPVEPRVKRKYKRRKKWNRRKRAITSEKVVALMGTLGSDAPTLAEDGTLLDERLFDGMRHSSINGIGCPPACGPKCIITGEEVCGHPDGNLQAKYQQMPEAKARFRQAVLALRRFDAEVTEKKG